jgi:glucose/arabinose dehydrogenase
MSDVYGGLLDVSLHPDFPLTRRVYIAYNDRDYGLAIARFTLGDGRAEAVEVIYESDEFSIGTRIEWQDADHFFFSHGVGGDPHPMAGPQDLRSDVGKIHRLAADGLVPADNPILPGEATPSSVWSYGHRNPQGLYFDRDEGRLYAIEHGPLGGDELNVVEAGENYGWPLFSYGLNYDGTPVSAMTESEAAAASTLPYAHWGPDFRVAPSGLLRVESGEDAGSFLLGALYPGHLLRYDPGTGETMVVLRGVGRVRDIAALPDGGFLISTDAGSPTPATAGRVIRLLPGARLP